METTITVEAGTERLTEVFVRRLDAEIARADLAEKRLREVARILRKSPTIASMLDRGFWDARKVDLVFRHDGETKTEIAGWLKELWYAARGRWDIVELSK